MQAHPIVRPTFGRMPSGSLEQASVSDRKPGHSWQLGLCRLRSLALCSSPKASSAGLPRVALPCVHRSNPTCTSYCPSLIALLLSHARVFVPNVSNFAPKPVAVQTIHEPAGKLAIPALTGERLVYVRPSKHYERPWPCQLASSVRLLSTKASIAGLLVNV